MVVIMASNAAKVFSLIPDPDRNDCLRAVSMAILRIRSQGWSRDALATKIGCSADTIDNASNEKTMLQFDSIVLLARNFPDEFKLVSGLWDDEANKPLTRAERADRIAKDTAILLRECGE